MLMMLPACAPTCLFLPYHSLVRVQATVGAGLPVISTLQSLLDTGDKVQRIEGILSGTLSCLFNTYQPGMAFSQVVAGAREKGYTEPDPREDLSGIKCKF